MAGEITLWNKVVSASMKIPGVAVNRENFLSTELKPYCTEQQIADALERGTVGVISPIILDKIATGSIRSHTRKTTLLSTAMGIPGGWAALGTTPTDIAQFYYHVFVVGQKLAYIYGYPDLRNGEGHLSRDGLKVLTIFVGVMTGVGVAVKALQELAEILHRQVIKKLPEYALSSSVLAPTVRQVAKWIGDSLSKGPVHKGISKALPLLGGAISGAMTYRTFKPQATRLKESLRQTMLLPAHRQPPQLLPPQDTPPQQPSQPQEPHQVIDVDYVELPPDLPQA